MIAFLLALAVVSAPAASGDRFHAVFLDDGQTTLESAESLSLLSLSPDEVPLFTFDVNAKPRFHGFIILGSTELRGATKTELLGKLYTALAEDASPARCFRPRHGIRVTAGERSIDLVICFECRQVQSFVNGKNGGSVISPSPADLFNKVLREARVPLSSD